MKDDFRWYNSVMFNQRDQIISQNPELAAQIHNNPSLKASLNTPAHILNKESFRNKPAPGQSKDQFAGPPAKLMVCCPQEDNRTRHGMKVTEDAVNTINSSENGNFVFKQTERISASMEGGL